MVLVLRVVQQECGDAGGAAGMAGHGGAAAAWRRGVSACGNEWGPLRSVWVGDAEELRGTDGTLGDQMGSQPTWTGPSAPLLRNFRPWCVLYQGQEFRVGARLAPSPKPCSQGPVHADQTVGDAIFAWRCWRGGLRLWRFKLGGKGGPEGLERDMPCCCDIPDWKYSASERQAPPEALSTRG